MSIPAQVFGAPTYDGYVPFAEIRSPLDDMANVGEYGGVHEQHAEYGSLVKLLDLIKFIIEFASTMFA